MLKDLLFAWRNLCRNGVHAALNVSGLSIGISACLLIYLIAEYELSFDRFQPDRDRIFRVYSEFSRHFKGVNAGVPTALPVLVRDQFTGIQSLTNFHTVNFDVKVPESPSFVKSLGTQKKVVIVEPDFFEVFTFFEWRAGSPQQSLVEPFSVVLSETAAKLYFGDTEPLDILGREIIYQDSLSVIVTGLIKDVGQRTDFDFTNFISFSTVGASWLEGNRLQTDTWNAVNSSSQFFVKLAPGTASREVAEQLNGISEMVKSQGKTWDDWRPRFGLQPLSDLHFRADLGIFDFSRPVLDRATLGVLTGVAFLLLILAVLNFVNLETAQASRRAREVGVRKVLGSSKARLVARFMAGSLILSVCAVILSLAWVKIAFNYFSEYIPEGLTFQAADVHVVVFLLCCIMFVTVAAGLYPAVMMSSFNAVSALKGAGFTHGASTRSAVMRKGFSVFQFTFSQAFVTASLIIALQLRYMVNKDLGFEHDAVVYLPIPSDRGVDRRVAMMNALAAIPEIEAFGAHGPPPVSGVRLSSELTFENGEESLKHNVSLKSGDTSYLRVYKIQLLSGRNVLPTDSVKEFVINETYMRLLGFTDPHDVIGKVIGKSAPIVGVVKDFHTGSLHSPIEPLVITYDGSTDGFGIRLFTPQNRVADLKPALTKIQAAWEKLYGDEHFNLLFVSDQIRRFYEAERRTGEVVTFAMVISLFISSLGLFGLSSFVVVQRRKEIGIRKVIGATVKDIVLLLSRDFLKPVAIAFFISTPVTYYLAGDWLQNFAYHIDLTGWIFLASGMFSILIVALTVSLRTLSASRADPVQSLRYE